MTTTLPNSGLRVCDIGDGSWEVDDQFNWDRLNDTLLKVRALLDVNAAGISDGDILVYNSTSTDWEVEAPPYLPVVTTTTTTTTTTV